VIERLLRATPLGIQGDRFPGATQRRQLDRNRSRAIGYRILQGGRDQGGEAGFHDSISAIEPSSVGRFGRSDGCFLKLLAEIILHPATVGISEDPI
jgi:hypothetical protein